MPPGLSLAKFPPVLPSQEEDFPQLLGEGGPSCRLHAGEKPRPLSPPGAAAVPGPLPGESAPGCSERLRIPPLAAVGLGKPRPSGGVSAVGRARGLANPLRHSASFALCLVVRTGHLALCQCLPSAGCPELACPHRPLINPLRSCGRWPRPGISPTRADALMPPHSLAPAQSFHGGPGLRDGRGSGLQLWVWPLSADPPVPFSSQQVSS